MPANLQSTFDVAQFEALLASRNEPEWLTTRRREAWDAFETAEQPEWRRTNLKGFNIADYSVAEADVSVEFAGAEGVTILPLAEAIQSHAELVQRVLGSAVQTSRDPYSALNNALVNGGIFIHVAKDVVVDELVRIRYHVANAGTIVAPRTLIVTERHSSINVIEEISSADFDASAVFLTGAEIEVGDGGKVKLQQRANFKPQCVYVGQPTNSHQPRCPSRMAECRRWERCAARHLGSQFERQRLKRQLERLVVWQWQAKLAGCPQAQPHWLEYRRPN